MNIIFCQKKGPTIVLFQNVSQKGCYLTRNGQRGMELELRKNKQTKSTCDQNIYVKKHVYGRKSIGSKPTKSFKKNKEKKKEKHTQSEPKNKFTC